MILIWLCFWLSPVHFPQIFLYFFFWRFAQAFFSQRSHPFVLFFFLFKRNWKEIALGRVQLYIFILFFLINFYLLHGPKVFYAHCLASKRKKSFRFYFFPFSAPLFFKPNSRHLQLKKKNKCNGLFQFCMTDGDLKKMLS